MAAVVASRVQWNSPVSGGAEDGYCSERFGESARE